MRTNWETYPIELKGGLMTNLSPLQQGINAPGSATVLMNFEPSIDGGYKKVLGYTKWTEQAVPGTGIMQGVICTGEQNAIAVRGGKYYFSEAFAAWSEKLDSSGSPGGRIRHTTFNFNGTTKTVIVNGATKPVIFDHTAETIAIDSAASSDVSGAEYVVEHRNHIFFAKGRNLIFTEPYDETGYDPGGGAGIVNISNDIVGLIPFRGDLIIFCRDQIHRLQGTSLADFVITPITKRTGCINGDTIQEVGGDILYLGPDGVRFLSATDRNEDFSLQRASENVQGPMTDLFLGQVSCASLVIRKKAQYRIFKWVEEEEAEDSKGFLATRFVDQQAQGVGWATLEGFKVYSADSKQFGQEEVVIFSSDTDYIYRMEDGASFDGADITCRYRTPNMPVNDPKLRKTWYRLTVYLNTSFNVSLNTQVILDDNVANTIQPEAITISTSTVGTSYFWGDLSTIYGSFTYSDAVDSLVQNNIVGSSFTVAFNFTEISSTSNFAIDTVVVEFRQNDRK